MLPRKKYIMSQNQFSRSWYHRIDGNVRNIKKKKIGGSSSNSRFRRMIWSLSFEKWSLRKSSLKVSEHVVQWYIENNFFLDFYWTDRHKILDLGLVTVPESPVIFIGRHDLWFLLYNTMKCVLKSIFTVCSFAAILS